jgi:predicted deacetylase
MKLIIRDDDLSYFTDPEHIKFIYKDVWDKCPVSFAAIPFICENVWGAVPVDCYTKKKIYHPLDENKRLVSFLKKKIKEGKATIVQHGYSHENDNPPYELERNDVKQLYKELKSGKDYLEKLFGIKIETLVAPHDRFSKAAIKAAKKVGYQYICRAFAPLPREIQFNPRYLRNYFKLFRFWSRHKRKYRYPQMLNWGKYKEIYSYRPDEILHKHNNIIKFHQKHKKSVLCITTHYRSMNLYTQELLRELINQADEVNHLNSV